MKTLLNLIVMLSLGLCLSAQAVTLDEARSTNQVTELPTGYVKANNEKAKSLVEEVNSKRKAAYEQIAKKNGLTVDQVAEQAAKKLENKQK